MSDMNFGSVVVIISQVTASAKILTSTLQHNIYLKILTEENSKMTLVVTQRCNIANFRVQLLTTLEK